MSGRSPQLGTGVTGWAVGDPCVALLAGGGYARTAVVPAGQVVPPPPGLDLVAAAGVIEVAATVQSNLANAWLAAGETILVHGGAGGIGSFAIPYAKHLGATVDRDRRLARQAGVLPVPRRRPRALLPGGLGGRRTRDHG